jgi:putative exosortase-associated protein (TIGR04073 family)
MRNAMPFLAVIALVALFCSGCAGPEDKLGRGLSNTYEVVRMGDLRRAYEQSVINDQGGLAHVDQSWRSYSGDGYTTGIVRGFDRSVTRVGVGLYEVVTFPIPPYHPVLTSYLTPGPVFPESYTPRRISDPTFDTDTYTGFSGGDLMPFIPGSRFNVFDN